MPIPPESENRLQALLAKGRQGKFVEIAKLKRLGLIPPQLSFGPDLCFYSKRESFLVYDLGTSALPDWVKDAEKQLRKYPDTRVVIFCRDTPLADARKLASPVISECAKLGFGQIVDIPEGVFWVLPPKHKLSASKNGKVECGHIPHWLRESLAKSECFSPVLTKFLKKFHKVYEAESRDNKLNYDDESAILLDFARDLAKADRRLFVPLGLLEALKQWERSGSNKDSRDHFFHTFNNFFSGLLLLGGLLLNRRPTEVPDRFIRDTSGIAKLYPWETIWMLTSLFHDAGYMGEHVWSTFFFGLGLESSASQNGEIPDEFKQSIINAWDTEHADARKDLRELFKRVCDLWEPLGFPIEAVERFDPALQKAYFDGKRPAHSLISGLCLLNQCRRDKAHKHDNYDPKTALKACVIAALSMMFHDPKTRHVLKINGIEPIPFELLPYATALIFVDALQEDRRDITTSHFSSECVLKRLEINRGKKLVLATVDLTKVKLESWPWKIVEYQQATAWINAASETKFMIDYSRPAFMK